MARPQKVTLEDPWSEGDDRLLCRLHRQGHSIDRAAELLNRSTESALGRAVLLGLYGTTLNLNSRVMRGLRTLAQDWQSTLPELLSALASGRLRLEVPTALSHLRDGLRPTSVANLGHSSDSKSEPPAASKAPTTPNRQSLHLSVKTCFFG